MLEPSLQEAQKCLFQHFALQPYDADQFGFGAKSVSTSKYTGCEATLPLVEPNELPLCTRFLLVASYIASYNPIDSDMQYFSIGTKHRKKRHRSNSKVSLLYALPGSRLTAARAQNQAVSRQFLGPQPFPFERLVAIFHSLVAENIDFGGKMKGGEFGISVTSCNGIAALVDSVDLSSEVSTTVQIA